MFISTFIVDSVNNSTAVVADMKNSPRTIWPQHSSHLTRNTWHPLRRLSSYVSVAPKHPHISVYTNFILHYLLIFPA